MQRKNTEKTCLSAIMNMLTSSKTWLIACLLLQQSRIDASNIYKVSLNCREVPSAGSQSKFNRIGFYPQPERICESEKTIKIDKVYDETRLVSLGYST